MAEERESGDALPRRIAAKTVDAEPVGNPLWALPLTQLAITRERPIFSPARRPPPPPAPAYVAPMSVRQPAKPPEPERPAISLLGTIIGAGDQIGVFLDTVTHDVIRLRIREDHRGWVLREIRERDAVIAKDGAETVVLELPPPGEAPALGGPTIAPSVGGMAAGTLPILSNTNSADEQPAGSTRGARRHGR
jgi:general secretion pathway protein N